VIVPAAPFSWSHLNQWNFSYIITAILLLVGAQYLAATWRAGAWPRVRTVCFFLGLVVTFIATQSVIGVYDMELFADHMVEHLLLIMVAAPLFALSAPIDLARAAGGRAARTVIASRPFQVALSPLFGFALYVAFIPATHLTSFFNLMIQHEWVHHAEQVGFLVVGYLFFRHAFGIEADHAFHPGLRLVYLMAAVPVDTFTGLVLDMEHANPYSAYNMMGLGTPTAALNQIHLGGAIMWIGGDALMLLALIPITVIWVKYETMRTRELDRVLDAASI
jgi:putative membrane protein